MNLMHGKAQHTDYASRDWREYMRKTELASSYPSRYLSLVLNGAEQSTFALPNL